MNAPTITVEYRRSGGYWMARYYDEIGRLGPSAFGSTKERAAFELGLLKGQHPEVFTRTIEELTKGEIV